MIKVGKFYKVYAKDAYIISYLFEYKIKEEGKMETCGFPEQILNKVKANLENKRYMRDQREQ